MVMLYPKFIVDGKGRKKAVVLSIKEFKEVVELVEDALDVKLIEEIKDEPTVPWEEVKKKLNHKSCS